MNKPFPFGVNGLWRTEFVFMAFRLVTLCTALISFFPGPAAAGDILNINRENTAFYDGLSLSPDKAVSGRNVSPISCYRLERSGLAGSDPGCPASDAGMWNVKPLSTITAKFLVGNEEKAAIPGSSGLVYYKGANLFLFEDGYATYGDTFAFYYQLKQVETEQLKQSQIFRAYAKYRSGKWSIEAGKDNVALGPGEYGGLLLSTHAEPYPLIKIATEEPLDFFGKWDVTFMNGWLMWDKQKDPSNSNVLAMRIAYSPADWFEFAATRITHYGGAGRPSYQPNEYLSLIGGGGEHGGGRFNNDGIVSYDTTLRLPLNGLFPSVKSFTIYDEEASGDFGTFWQSYPAGAKQVDFIEWGQPSNTIGMTLALEDDFFRLEYNRIVNGFYLHLNYPYEGYSFHDVSLGAFTGTNSRSLVYSHLHRFSGQARLKYQIGEYEDPKVTQPYDPPVQMWRYFLVVEPQISFGPHTVSLYMRYDRTTNYDTNFMANQYSVVPENKDFYTLGISVTMAL